MSSRTHLGTAGERRLRGSRQPGDPAPGRRTPGAPSRRPPAGVVLAGAALAAASLSGCGAEDTLPGRSRPIFEPGWPGPGELALDSPTFIPGDPGEARFETPNGVRACIVSAADGPLVRLTAALPLGRLHEAEGEAGASAVLIRLLATRGAGDRNRPLSLRLAELGTSVSVEESLDAARISLNVLPEDWREGLELLVGLLRTPDLDAVGDDRVGPGFDMPIAGIGGDGFRPKVELERRIHGYPLAPPEPGTTVPAAAVRALAARSLAADRVVLGIGGPVARDQVEAALTAMTRDWAPLGPPASEPALIAPREVTQRLHIVEVPSLEGWIAIGRAVGAVPASDRAALAVLRFILAERLNIAAREMRGLANRDDFQIPDTASGTGLLLVRTGGRPEAVGPLVRYSLDEIARLHDPEDPVTEAELTRAQGWLLGAVWQRSLELATSASATLALEHLRHGHRDRLMEWPAAVRSVTSAEVQRIASRYLDPAGFVTVVAGPLEAIRAARHPRWPVALEDLEAELSGGR